MYLLKLALNVSFRLIRDHVSYTSYVYALYGVCVVDLVIRMLTTSELGQLGWADM